MIESRCGILCSKCDYREPLKCDGCINISMPVWGEQCPVKFCCEDKKLEHCGQCAEVPCEILIQYAYDKEHGDDGKRIEQCKLWEKK